VDADVLPCPSERPACAGVTLCHMCNPCYPMQFSPSELDLRPGAQGRIQLSYTPQATSRREALVTIVDDARQRPVDMVIVRLDSTATRISRSVFGTQQKQHTIPYAVC
jgi:hypothetical protein